MFLGLDIYTLVGIIGALYSVNHVLKKFGGDSSQSTPYLTKDDPNAQNIYTAKMNNPTRMTKNQKIELSWLFLYDITDTIINKFSQDDQKKINDLGQKMLEGGGMYEHVVEYGIKKEKKRSKIMSEHEEPAKDADPKQKPGARQTSRAG